MLSLDETVIDLCVAVLDWAKLGKTKGAVKLYVLLEDDGYLWCYEVVTEGKVHEIQVARKLKLQSGTMLVLDRGYTDYEWFGRLREEEVHLVTRVKDNAGYLVVERGSAEEKGILADEIIAMEKQAQVDTEMARFLRGVRYWDEIAQGELVFLRNHLELGAVIIGGIYKERWQIELLFKAL